METIATWFSGAGAGAFTAGAGASTVAASSGTFSMISTFASIAQGLSQLVGGVQQQGLYEAQAAQARISSRGEAVKYEQQANGIARRALEAQAMARARAAAGGVDPFSGSAQFIQSLSSQDAGEEIDLSRENAKLAALGGAQQADAYLRAGRTARTRGLLSGLATGAVGFGQVSRVGGAPRASTFTTGLFSPNNAALNAYEARIFG